MSVLVGLVLLYVPVALLAAVFWLVLVRRLFALWVGRDVMETLIPDRRHVSHTERLLRLRP